MYVSPSTPASAKLAYANSDEEMCTQNHGLSRTGLRVSSPGFNAGMIWSTTTIGRMKTPIARSSVESSRYRYESVSSQTNVEMALEALANGTWPTSIVCMPMTNV